MPADKPRRLSRVRSRIEARRPPATLSPARTGRRCAPKRSEDPRSGATCRPHYLDSMVQRAVARAADAAGTEKRAMCHTLRPERSEEVVLDCGTRLPRTCCRTAPTWVPPCSTSTSWSRPVQASRVPSTPCLPIRHRHPPASPDRCSTIGHPAHDLASALRPALPPTVCPTQIFNLPIFHLSTSPPSTCPRERSPES